MTSTEVGTIFSGFTDSVSDALVANLPAVLAIAAGLIALGILVRYVKKHVGRK
jgi:hypothetical protein